MKKIVGVRFKPAGKVYDFDCGAFVLKRGDHVIVETEKGLGFGTVAVPPAPCKERPPDKPLKKMYRLASEEDFKDRFPECEVGAMPPFGNIYGMDVYVAASLAEDEEIAFNAGTHTELIRLDYQDFERLVQPRVAKLSKRT